MELGKDQGCSKSLRRHYIQQRWYDIILLQKIDLKLNIGDSTQTKPEYTELPEFSETPKQKRQEECNMHNWFLFLIFLLAFPVDTKTKEDRKIHLQYRNTSQLLFFKNSFRLTSVRIYVLHKIS